MKNPLLTLDKGPPWTCFGFPMDAFPRPAETIMLGDHGIVDSSQGYTVLIATDGMCKPGWSDLNYPAYCQWNCPPMEVRIRHNGGLNYGFLDGHAKWMQFDATKPHDDVGSLWGYGNDGQPN